MSILIPHYLVDNPFFACLLIIISSILLLLYSGNACHYSPYHPSAITVGALEDASPGSGANPKTSTTNYGECIDVWGEFISCLLSNAY